MMFITFLKIVFYLKFLATNKENFTNALRSILEDETYQEAHVFIKEILNKLDVDQSIPIYISNRPKRG